MSNEIKTPNVHARKKRTLGDIIGIVKSKGNAVESKKSIQKRH